MGYLTKPIKTFQEWITAVDAETIRVGLEYYNNFYKIDQNLRFLPYTDKEVLDEYLRLIKDDRNSVVTLYYDDYMIYYKRKMGRDKKRLVRINGLLDKYIYKDVRTIIC